MSIYGTRRDRSLDDDLAWEQVLQRGTAQEPVPPADPPAPQDWTSLRKASPLNELLPATRRWLGTLPSELRPLALVTGYPRIVNLIAQQWTDPKSCGAYFDELLIGRRGGRRGFPGDVRRDIRELREHFMRSQLATGSGSSPREL